MGLKELAAEQNKAIDKIKKLCEKPQATRGFSFVVLVAILKIAIPALINILEKIDGIKYEKAIKALEFAAEVLKKL